ncbi:hypothetical protein I6M35_05810 [Shewanella algae]|nr:hypothetical protein [Shewanella algae]
MTQTAAEPELQPQAEVGQVVQQLTLLEGEAQAEVFGEILEEAEPGTIALLLESLPLDERYERWNQIAFAERSAVLSLMRAEPRMSLLRQMSVEEVDLLLAQLSAEEMIELIAGRLNRETDGRGLIVAPFLIFGIFYLGT